MVSVEPSNDNDSGIQREFEPTSGVSYTQSKPNLGADFDEDDDKHPRYPSLIRGESKFQPVI